MSQLHIDPGHGGLDNGAQANGFVEKVLNLECSLYQEKRFKELGIDVSMTRRDDTNYTSRPRTDRVKRSGAKICLSNHFNAGGGTGCETIHSIYSDGKLARMIADELVKAGEPLRRVFSRKGVAGDYYYMHRLTGSVETVIIEYAFLDSNADAERIRDKDFRFKLYEAAVKATAEYMGVKYDGKKTKPAPKEQTKSVQVETNVKKVSGGYEGASIKSKADNLRYYNTPSWEDTDVYGHVNKGYGFPEIVAKYKVDNGFQYKVKNSKGNEFFITAADKYVEVEKKKPSYIGKRVEAIAAKVNFYDSPRWNRPTGQFSKGQGWTIVGKLTTNGSPQYQVKNSKGDIYYITARKDLVKVIY